MSTTPPLVGARGPVGGVTALRIVLKREANPQGKSGGFSLETLHQASLGPTGSQKHILTLILSCYYMTDVTGYGLEGEA